MLYLNRNIRYRRENDFIMICDCKNLMDFELPLYYESLLATLQRGYDEAQPIGVPDEKELLADFHEMEIISNGQSQILL